MAAWLTGNNDIKITAIDYPKKGTVEDMKFLWVLKK